MLVSGDPFPDLIKKCVESWKVKLPDYEIKCWNTDNFDVNIAGIQKRLFKKKNMLLLVIM